MRVNPLRLVALVAGMSCIASAFAIGTTAPGGALTERYDLPMALEFALEHNANVVSKRAALQNAEANFAGRHALEFPSLTGTLAQQTAKSSNTGISTFGQTQQNVFSQNTAQIGSQVTLYNGSLNQINAEQAKRLVESSKADYERARQQLAVDVANGYYAIVARREAIAIAASDRAYQMALLDVARYREKVGQAAGVDVLRAEVQELRSEATLATVRDDAATASEALAITIGAPAEATFVAPAAIPEPALPASNADTLVAIAEDARPDLLAASGQVASSRLSDAAIDANLKPTITLSGAFGNVTTPTSFGPSKSAVDQTNAAIAAANAALPAGSPKQPLQTFSRAQPGFWSVNLNSTFNLPFVEYGSRRAQHRAARSQVDANLAFLHAAQTQVEADVRQALRTAKTAAVNLTTQRRAADYGAEAARIAQLQFRNGLISLTDVTQAQQTAQQSALDLINARVTYVNAVVRLRTAIGTYDPLATVNAQ